jgi:hypothetical protein
MPAEESPMLVLALRSAFVARQVHDEPHGRGAGEVLRSPMPWRSSMQAKRAFLFGVLGASAMTVVSAVLRAAGLPIHLELLLGTATTMAPGQGAFVLGLAIHLAIGGAFGLVYGWLMETVWNHGGAATGMILGVIHAALIGMAVGLTPQFHPYVPERIADPGPFFANAGAAGVICFFGIHVLYGAIVGRGYGHVSAEREWAPAGRL